MHKILNIRHNDYIVRPEHNMKTLGTQNRICRKKAKRIRIAFTTEQINYMEEQFKKFPYINNSHRQEIALILNIPERAVKVWFQNRRMREKKDVITKEDNIEASKLKQLDILKNKSKESNISPNDQQYTTSLRNEVKHFNYHNKVTNGAVSGLNSVLSARNHLDISDNFNSNKDCKHPTIVHPHCSIIPGNHFKFEKIVKPFGQNIKDKVKNNTSCTSPVMRTCQHMNIYNLSEKRKNDDKSRELKPAEEVSLNQKMNNPKTGKIEEPNERINDPKYIFMVPDITSQMQPYYPTGGIIWNPINLVPAVNPVNVCLKTNSSNLVIDPHNKKEMSSMHGATNCFCNCHYNMMPKLSDSLQEQPSCPQYLLSTIHPSTRTFL